MIAKRPTEKVKHLGLVVQKGLYGFYLSNPKLERQKSRCYDKSGDCVAAALNGERPVVPTD